MKRALTAEAVALAQLIVEAEEAGQNDVVTAGRALLASGDLSAKSVEELRQLVKDRASAKPGDSQC